MSLLIDVETLKISSGECKKIWSELRERFLATDIHCIHGNNNLICMPEMTLAQFALHYLHKYTSHAKKGDSNNNNKLDNSLESSCVRVVVPVEEWEYLTLNEDEKKHQNLSDASKKNMQRRSIRRNQCGMVISSGFYGLTLAQVRLFLCMIRKETIFDPNLAIATISTTSTESDNKEEPKRYILSLGDFAIRYVCNKHFSDYKRKKKKNTTTTTTNSTTTTN